jgi:glycosyltransferase involved in cell wall biosynthesis
LAKQRSAILIVVQVYPDGGGIAAIVENLVTLLGSRLDTHVAVVDPRAGAGERLGLPVGHLHVLGRSPLANALMMPGSIVFAIRTTHWLRKVIAEVHPEAVLVQDALDLPVPAALAIRGTGAKLAIMDHGTLSNVLDRRWQRMMRERLGGVRGRVFSLGFHLDAPWRALRWRLGLRAADGAWYVGYELAERFAWAGASAHRYVQLVPRDFRPPIAGEREAARAYFGLAQDAVVVNMVTRLDPEKNLDGILDAVHAALQRQPRMRLVIGGDGNLRDWLEHQLGIRGMASRVLLLGRLSRSDIQRVHHASDLHLYAGIIGCGMSVALLEAMSCGVVPIVSDVPREHRELVDAAGWVFSANDPSALCAALLDAVTAPPDALATLRGAVSRRLNSYSQPSLIALLEGLLEWPAFSTSPATSGGIPLSLGYAERES